MSKQLLRTLYLCCLFGITFFSCKKNIDKDPVIPTPVFPVPLAEPVTGTVSGRIIDENNAPVASALVECGNLNTTTNADGFFTVKNATLDKYISTVTVTKPGYFKAYRSFSANASRNYVSIKLLPKVLTGTIDAASGGSISVSSATSVRFQQNSIVVKSSGAAFSGTVNVYAHYIDPTSREISYTIPGSLMATDGVNLYSLQSAGMIAVDIESTSGEPLQLVSGKPATVQLEIPSSLVSAAPNTIDTWSLNDKGIWQKEATATKNGNHYEFEASHFSFWNCDVSANAIYLSLHLQDAEGVNLENRRVRLSYTSNGFSSSSYGYTDNMGNVSGLVPSGVDLTLDIVPSYFECDNEEYYTQNLGSFTSNATQTITVIFTITPPNILVSISGTVLDCNGQPLPSGNALIWQNNDVTYAEIVNGDYTALLVACSSVPSVNMVVSDNNSIEYSSSIVIPLSGSAVTAPTVTMPCPASRNIYDGIYQVTSTLLDHTSSAYTAYTPYEMHAVTTGPSSVVITRAINGTFDPGYLFFTGTGGSYYGNLGVIVSFDPATNKVNELHNYYGDPANPPTIGNASNPAGSSGAPDYWSTQGPSVRRADFDPASLNVWADPDGSGPLPATVDIKYFMYQTTYMGGTSPRVEITEHWEYIGPRL